MRNVTRTLRTLMLLTVSMFFFVTSGLAQQTVLLNESFESGNGATPPAGWALEQVSGTTLGVTFVTSSTNPTINAAYDGTKFVRYNAYNITSGQSTRLKNTTAMSTVNKSFIMVEFAWYEDPGYSTYADKVDVQWSTNGTSWTTAATYNRYNAVAGWKSKNVILPSGANGQTTLYVGFLFTSAFGNNCSMDMVKVTAGPAAPPAFVTVGTGTTTVGYPYYTFYMGSRTQMLYTAAELTSAGGSAGNFLSVGLNVSTAYPQVMQNFTIKMGHTTSSTLTGWVTTGMNTVYQVNYGVPGTGWRDITLTTPFAWNGTSNVVVEICFGDNGSYTSNSMVMATAAAGQTWHYHADYYAGCTGTSAGAVQSDRPNIRFGTPAITPGALMGYVKDVNTLQPIAGAIVMVGTKRDTSRANGFYIIYNLPSGAATANATATGYISGSASGTITAGQATSLDIMMAPGPKVGGTVTDASTGAPVIGATVTVGGVYQTMSVAGGVYLTPLLSVSGNNVPIVIGKTGYDDLSGTVNLVPNTTATYNAALLPTAVPPGQLTAALNGTPGTAVNLNWTGPLGMYQLINDDGIQDNFAIWANTNNLNAIKFTALAYPCKLVGGKVNLGTSANYPANALPLLPFKMMAYKADGPNGVPGTLIDSVEVTPTGFGWADFTFINPISINSGDFFLAMKQGGIPPHAAGLGVDLTNPLLRSYSKFVTGNGPWVPAAGNFMIRAIMQGAGGPILDNASEPRLITAGNPEGLIYEAPVQTITGYEGNGTDAPLAHTYQVWRLKQGEEGNQAVWTSIYTGANLTTVDNSWPTLACAPYRWAVKAIYSPPGTRPSPPTFSNILEKCWRANVNVCVSLTCLANPKAGTLVKMVNTVYPDTNYTQTTDTSGCVHFTNVYKGTYTMTVTRFTYPIYTQNVTINGDANYNVTLLQTTQAPSNLTVNDQTLKATWNPPRTMVYQLNEDFSGGFATNQWTTSGGSNFSVSTGTGNPAPSATFTYLPQVTNYNQYLTSKSLAGIHAPQMQLKYDIFLDNYGNTYLNSMAVELWNGATWTVLKTYDNSSGANIPWTSETLDISSQTHNPAFQVRFHASGQDSYDIDAWYIDNVKVVSGDGNSGPNPCVIGYNFYLNGVLSAFTPDTTYNIPPNQVVYGQTYNACVKAVYASGYSQQICYSFMAKFLYPARNLSVEGVECNAYLTWQKPVTMGDAPGDNQAYAPKTSNQPAADISANGGSPMIAPVSVRLSDGIDATNAILFDNGPLVNSPGTGAGGADESVLLSPLGTYGFGAQQSASNTMADDFIVPAGGWSPTKFTFYTYQTGAPTTGTITGLYFRIYNGDPTAGGTVIWGDMTTNRMTFQGWSNIYRTQAVGGATDRAIMKVEATVSGLTLPQGVYWVEFQFNGSGSSGPWAPPITITGTPGTGNGKQNQAGTWVNAMDGSYQQGLPFIIEGPGSGGGGQTPAGLIGYNIYRGGNFIHYNPHPDSITYWDYNLNPGTYKYDVKAKYDLTPYGFAGQFGESLTNTAGEQTVNLICGAPLPFYEPWDQGIFTFNQWAPSGHWTINTGIGNPAPSADFHWDPILNNYSQALVSQVIDASAWTCANIWLDFDVKLIDRNATGKEKLTIDLFYNGFWHQKLELSNNGSTNWVPKHLDISAVKGKSFRVRFVASGENSGDMLHWYLDNIHAYGICTPPAGLTASQTQFTTTLNWTAPNCGSGSSGTIMNFMFDDGSAESGVTDNGEVAWLGTEFPISAAYDGVLKEFSMYWMANASGAPFTMQVDVYNAAHQLLGSSASFQPSSDDWVTVTAPDIPFAGPFYAMVKWNNNPTQTNYLGWDNNGPYAAQDLGWYRDATGAWAKLSSFGLGIGTGCFTIHAKALVGADDKVVTLVPGAPATNVQLKSNMTITNRKVDTHFYGIMGPETDAADSSVMSGFNVYRTDATGANFSKIAGPITGTSYVDNYPTTLENATFKYFVAALYKNSANNEVLCEPHSDTILVKFPATGINDLTNSQIMIFPNPATEKVNIKSDYTISRIDVMNFAGQTVYTNSEVNAKSTQINVASFATGVYFVKVSTSQGVRLVKVTVTH